MYIYTQRRKLMKGDIVELAAFICYLVVVLAMGVYFFLKGKKTESGDKDYFLGGRNMNGLVAALSAGASDMSAWVLMGLPGSIYLYGMGQVWISVGLLIGTVCAWTFVAPRLRRYSIKANDSITIPQFLVNRFQSKIRRCRLSVPLSLLLPTASMRHPVLWHAVPCLLPCSVWWNSICSVCML